MERHSTEVSWGFVLLVSGVGVRGCGGGGIKSVNRIIELEVISGPGAGY